MLAPTSGARFLGVLELLGVLVLLVFLELLAQLRSPSHFVASEKGSATPISASKVCWYVRKFVFLHH